MTVSKLLASLYRIFLERLTVIHFIKIILVFTKPNRVRSFLRG